MKNHGKENDVKYTNTDLTSETDKKVYCVNNIPANLMMILR